jgi:hypothetical protein
MIANKKKTACKMKGSGITARKIKELNTDDWDPIFEADDRMKAELGREPDYFDWVSFGPLKWAEKVLRALGEKAKPKPDSPVDFAQRMVDSGVKARLSLDRGNAAEAAYHAFNLGELVTAVRIKETWEKPALSGNASLKGAHTGGLIKAEQSRRERESNLKDWQSRAEEIWRKYPTKYKKYVAKQIFKELEREDRERQALDGVGKGRLPSISTLRQSIKKRS